MKLDARILLGGVLALAAVLLISAVIQAVAPYLAAAIVAGVVLYAHQHKDDDQGRSLQPEEPPPRRLQIKHTRTPRE